MGPCYYGDRRVYNSECFKGVLAIKSGLIKVFTLVQQTRFYNNGYLLYTQNGYLLDTQDLNILVPLNH